MSCIIEMPTATMVMVKKNDANEIESDSIDTIDKIPIATVISPTTFEIINVKSFVLEKNRKGRI